MTGGPEVATRGVGQRLGSQSLYDSSTGPQVSEGDDGRTGSRYPGSWTMVKVSVHVCHQYRFYRSVRGVTGGPEVVTRGARRW